MFILCEISDFHLEDPDPKLLSLDPEILLFSYIFINLDIENESKALEYIC